MLQLLNVILNDSKKNVPHDYENENENEDVELEKYILSEEENGYLSRTASVPISKDINDESDVFDSLRSEECSFPPTELDNDDYLSHEIFGFGANKKVHNVFCHVARFPLDINYYTHYLVVLCNEPIERFVD